MSKILALVAGVSDYSLIRQNNLPFCVNDIEIMTKALIQGLKTEKSNIEILGEKGTVYKSDFLNAFKRISENIKEEDTFFLYFSGHGGNMPTGHHLLFSDGILRTQELIEILDKVHAKNIILVLDCCMSGNFEIKQTNILLPEMSISDFIGKGYVVFASSNSTQVSYGHPDKSVSLFTSFLCDAITDKHLIKKGNKSLHDIQRLLFLYLSIWNKNNPQKQQNPIFRSNLGGTIIFPVDDYIPYRTEKFYYETDQYIILSVSPVHNGLAKKYCVKVILQEPFSFEEIAEINHEIVERVKKVEIYNNKISEKLWRGKNANIIFCYFGRDEFDIANSNYICHTTWVDETQDRNQWYRISKNCEIIKQIHFYFHSYYSTLRIFEQEHTGEKDKLVLQTREIINQLISLAEKTIRIYNEFLNGTINENKLVELLKPILPLIDKWYFEESNLDIAPLEIKEWSQACSNIAATVHDFTFLYNEKHLSKRSSSNRKSCMDITIQRYYEDLERLYEMEQT